MKAFIDYILRTYQSRPLDLEKRKESIPHVVLYHYSSIDGLCGILKTKSIWASDIQFLNDKSEFKHGVSLISKDLRQISEKRAKQKNDDQILGFLKASREFMDQRRALKNFQIFVASFSTKSDLLSQWRGYCPENLGFSLGFKLIGNNFTIGNTGFELYLLPCFYTRKDEKKLIQYLKNSFIEGLEQLINESSNEASQNNSLEQFSKLNTEYVKKYLIVSSILKDQLFSEEDEWRLIAISKRSSSKSEVLFRKGSSLLIPYIDIELNRVPFRLQEIVIGPTQYPKLSKESIGQIKKKKDYKFKIRNSKIPFRKV